MTKSFKSAVVIIPPEESDLYQAIQDIRRVHDKQFNRWMPHINLIYPFYEESQFDIAAEQLRPLLAKLKPFKTVFCEQSFGYFKHNASNSTIWLKPICPVSVTPPKPASPSDDFVRVDEIPSPAVIALEAELPNLPNPVQEKKKSKKKSNNATTSSNDNDQPDELDSFRSWDNLSKDELTSLANEFNAHSMFKNTDWVDVAKETSSSTSTAAVPKQPRRKFTKSPPLQVHVDQQKQKQGPLCFKDVPSSSNHPKVMELQEQIQFAFPDCHDLRRVAHGFQPHLSLGQFSPKDHDLETVVKEFQEDWKDVEFLVDSIHFISRQGPQDPFQVIKTLKLGEPV